MDLVAQRKAIRDLNRKRFKNWNDFMVSVDKLLKIEADTAKKTVKKAYEDFNKLLEKHNDFTYRTNQAFENARQTDLARQKYTYHVKGWVQMTLATIATLGLTSTPWWLPDVVKELEKMQESSGQRPFKNDRGEIQKLEDEQFQQSIREADSQVKALGEDIDEYVKDVKKVNRSLKKPKNTKMTNKNKFKGDRIKQFGGSVEIELDDNEVQDYIRRGYTVEEIN